MINKGKCNILSVLVDAVDYEYVVDRVIDAARKRTPLGVSALAVHGVLTGVADKRHRHRLNQLEIVTPDGQPVRWLMNMLYGIRLRDRVYGPLLTSKVLLAAATEGIPVFLYGSSPEVNKLLRTRLEQRFSRLIIAGAEPSKFRRLACQERQQLLQGIKNSGALITLVGLGCPRQEVFLYENRQSLSMPVLAVGAAFDYHAGVLSEPPPVVQRLGLQWLYRLCQEPRRLAKRYAVLNTQFTILAAAQVCRLWHPDPYDAPAPTEEVSYG